MLKLFKSKVKQIVEENVFSNSHTYPEVVQEIHNEFESASDKLLAEAYLIINSQPEVNSSKTERLNKLGFKNVSEVKTFEKIVKETKFSEKQIELVKYYKNKYPLNKFIVESQVKDICHKYNLVFASIDRFTGFVPDKNLTEIENFKLKDTESNTMILENIDNGTVSSLVNCEIKKCRSFYHIYKKDNEDIYSNQFLQSRDGVNFYGSKSLSLRDEFKNAFDELTSEDDKFFLSNISFKSGLQICAPVKDMNINGLTLKDGYRLHKHIPDPVVLQPVKGGYLILTAWGDEASDPIVLNENLN